MTDDSLALVWLRRDLRLHDHAAMYYALQCAPLIQPVFIFDTDILVHFPNALDRRLTFIAKTLVQMDAELQKRGSGLLVVHGKAVEIIPKLARILQTVCIVAAEDYEPDAIKRDKTVAEHLPKNTQLSLFKDQLVMGPNDVLKDNGEPLKVFTPYAKRWRANLTPLSTMEYPIKDKGRYADIQYIRKQCKKENLPILECKDVAHMLKAIGYQEVKDELWPMDNARKRLQRFINVKAENYKTQRDIMAEEGTSRLSPYIRFGLVSVRECVSEALDARADTWLTELIWREFYATILYHYPESAATEWNPKYREKLDWSHNEAHFKAWQEGKTGYPVIDAAMRQLQVEGWMHNRARMIVASFLTKNLQIDWRKGEAHFAQYLMDYDLASNVGGWQWCASTGTDAQPYFRVFNPTTQSKKFDPEGKYIRRYVPELTGVSAKAIHAPWEKKISYYKPIVDLSETRKEAIAMFKKVAYSAAGLHP